MTLRPALRHSSSSSPNTSTASVPTQSLNQGQTDPSTDSLIPPPSAGTSTPQAQAQVQAQGQGQGGTSSSHISIQVPPAPERERDNSTSSGGPFGTSPGIGADGSTRQSRRRSSGALTPGEVHSALHGGHGGHGHGHVGLGSGSGIGFPRTSTQGSAGEGRYRRKVGFEAFEAGPDTLFAYTSQAKSDGFKRSRGTRVFMIAVSPDESGESALDWLMNELAEDGDEIVALRVLELDDEERNDPAALSRVREEAHSLLEKTLEKNNELDDERKISVVVEVVIGRVTDMLLKMIALYRPDSLIVGTRGSRSRFQTIGRAIGAPGMGSVSRFAVSHSPIPVIVVRPERKVKKYLEKRQNNPKRGHYAQIVGPNGLELSRSRSRGSIGGLSDKE